MIKKSPFIDHYTQQVGQTTTHTSPEEIKKLTYSYTIKVAYTNDYTKIFFWQCIQKSFLGI